MKILKTTDSSFSNQWQSILKRSSETPLEIETSVRDIIQDIQKNGDRSLLQYTQKFDSHAPKTLEVTKEEVKAALKNTDKEAIKSLQLAARRIEKFHCLQKKKLASSWNIEQSGTFLGEQIRPLDRVGIYVPGGLATYPSTVLMNAIAARVAGVKEIIMVSPWNHGKVNPYTLVAAQLAGVTKIFKVGGAQAIAALAYGTSTIPSVDKIVGPGNIYVATAKRLVFGKVGIDMIAGPTEVVVIADASANPEHIAADLLSQAEHDPRATAILLTPSEKIANSVSSAVAHQLEHSGRREILEQALKNFGVLIVTKNINEAIQLSNEFAAEHLEIQTKNPRKLLPQIRNAGAIFLGAFSPVAFGDYLAGPNHVLPTSGTARFSSPLGVVDFLKRSSVIEMSSAAFKKLGPDVIRLATLEGLTAHAASVEIRLKRK